jgi:uncharacterized radical SAM protein YgiQ
MARAMIRSNTAPAPPLPMTPQEIAARGWDAVDVVFVTGDAYVDHPSFAAAVLGRVLEAAGFRVAILSQPDWHSCRPWQTFGRPRLCFCISAGNLDSMLAHYTPARKPRSDDAYSPDGRAGLRPDRATVVYCQRAREAYKGVPIITGGVEASMRRIAHYDYWSDKVRRSILLDAKADLLVYGMGERTLVEIVRRLAAGQSLADLRNLRGVAYRLGASQTLPKWQEEPARPLGSIGAIADRSVAEPSDSLTPGTSLADDDVILPSYEEVAADKKAFVEMTRLAQLHNNPYCTRRLVQYHGREAVVINPPALPLAEAELDWIYELPFTRQAHPSYAGRRIPALEVVKNSVQILRGCFGGCTFCSLGAHQGRVIQSRSRQSVLREVHKLASQPRFSGTITDLGGPTANMYAMGCLRPETAARCRRPSCLYPKICKLLRSDHRPLLELMRAVRQVPGVKHVFVASGVRMDLALRCKQYIHELARHHTGGLLKVAPEHCDPHVLKLMHKPPVETFLDFAEEFRKAVPGRKLYLVPYFMAGHPGCDLDAMIRLAQFLKRTGYRPEQVQDFVPLPMEVATCMYYTGLDPFTGKEVYVARGARERRLQRALLQFFKPENYHLVREVLVAAGRQELIGDGPDCLIPAKKPAAASKPKATRPTPVPRRLRPTKHLLD